MRKEFSRPSTLARIYCCRECVCRGTGRLTCLGDTLSNSFCLEAVEGVQARPDSRLKMAISFLRQAVAMKCRQGIKEYITLF